MRWSLLTCSYDYRELITWICVMLLRVTYGLSLQALRVSYSPCTHYRQRWHTSKLVLPDIVPSSLQYAVFLSSSIASLYDILLKYFLHHVTKWGNRYFIWIYSLGVHHYYRSKLWVFINLTLIKNQKPYTRNVIFFPINFVFFEKKNQNHTRYLWKLDSKM